MLKAIMYKEWLKVRWVYTGAVILGFLVLGEILIHINRMMIFNEANSVWYYIIFKKYIYYDIFKYLLLVAGLFTGIFQFFPEVQEKRLKLTLHLPMKENKVMLQMVGFGFLLLTALFVVLSATLTIIVSSWFASEMVVSLLETIAPWLLGGYAVYFFVSMIFIEPLWSRKILMGIVAYIFVNFLLFDIGYGAYINSIFLFAVFTLLLGMLIIVSGYRFKRGTR